MLPHLKHPEKRFEHQIMEKHGLKYDEGCLKNMKKNSKTCAHLLYNLQVRSWKDTMMTEIKEKLNITLAVTAPKQIRGTNHNYRREPNTFFVGKKLNGKLNWTQVSFHCAFNINVCSLLCYSLCSLL